MRYREGQKIWEARLYVPVQYRALYDGKREVSFYAKRRDDALAKRERARQDMLENRTGAAKGTFGEYLERWLESLNALGAVSERTAADHRYYTERHLIPGLGKKKLRELAAEDLDTLYARLFKNGVGVRSINHVHSAARVALQRAVKKRIIPYNPARDADPPRYSTDEREYRTLSWEEIGRFFEAAKGDRYEAFFVVATLSGIRPAELRALAWEDAKLEVGHLTIRRTVSQGKAGPFIRNATKTGKARTVPLLPEAVAALKAHRARQNEERMAKRGIWREQDLVFADHEGGIVRRENLSRRHFKPLLERAGLPKDIRLYDLRHTFATRWIESGEQIETLSGILGHARISTTSDKYLHPSNQARRDAMGRFGRELGG